jgi:hypothetical protein
MYLSDGTIEGYFGNILLKLKASARGKVSLVRSSKQRRPAVKRTDRSETTASSRPTVARVRACMQCNAPHTYLPGPARRPSAGVPMRSACIQLL